MNGGLVAEIELDLALLSKFDVSIQRHASIRRRRAGASFVPVWVTILPLVRDAAVDAVVDAIVSED